MYIIVDNDLEEINRVEFESDAIEICNNYNYGLPDFEQITYYEED